MTDVATRSEAAAAETDGEQELICFVVIGFGRKADYATGRVLDLDLTYEKLIKPALDAAGIRGFRAIDVNASGNIDALTYRWLYQADLVIADLSTMDADVFFQLGVRYAQRPLTTLVMAEDGLFGKLPFDLSHTVIYGYEHLGEEIADGEAHRFVALLTQQLEGILAAPPSTDSPVYTYLPGMQEPVWVGHRPLREALAIRLDAQAEFQEAAATEGPIDLALVEQQSLGTLLEGAQAAFNIKDFATAKRLYANAIDRYREGSSELGAPVPHYLWQRLALVTYQQVSRNDPGDPDANSVAIETLEEAMHLLLEGCAADTSTDPETLGLSGAINKRLYERTGDREYFGRSVGFYERGFYISQDYYSGINVAFMYTVDAANLAERGDRFGAIVSHGHANIIRSKVAAICEAIIADDSTFERRSDQVWVYQALWEAYFGMGEAAKAEALEPDIHRVAADWAIDSWEANRERLGEALATFARLIEPGAAAAPPGAVAPGDDVTLADLAASHATLQADVQELRRLLHGAPAPADVGEQPDRPVHAERAPQVPAPIPPRMPSAPARDQIFISYSHADEEWRTQLKKFLRPVSQFAHVWDDTDIKTGRNWHLDIQEAVAATRIALLLVTQDFFDSDYIRGDEFRPFVAASESGELDIWWIAVGYSTWEHSELKSLQCANDPNRPLESLTTKAEVDKALLDIANELVKAAGAWAVP